MINEIKQVAEDRMKKCLVSLKGELAKVRTGRAHPSLLEDIHVSYYGNEVPLSQVASVNVSDARTLSVKPWEKAMISEIEKAIRTSELGLNPATSSDVIRVPLPVLTEERRKDLTKIVRHECEGARVAIRNVRRDANNQVKDLLKEKSISEDDERRGQDTIQQLTDKYIADVESMLSSKEAELMEI